MSGGLRVVLRNLSDFKNLRSLRVFADTFKYGPSKFLLEIELTMFDRSLIAVPCGNRLDFDFEAVVRRLNETEVSWQRNLSKSGYRHGQQWAAHMASKQALRNLEAGQDKWFKIAPAPMDHCWAAEASHDAQVSEVGPLIGHRTLFGDYMPPKGACNWFFVSGFVFGAIDVWNCVLGFVRGEVHEISTANV